ncbi:MAG: zinc metallopeptidase [Muribaculaceae bacterium]|nr:zinc metallopeptidase [Muribaculaceae bacterium]
MIVYIIFIAITIASWLVQRSLKSKFEKYSRVPLNAPLAGRDVAQLMLAQNGINDVAVMSTAGSLTDHYNPANQTVNLSQPVFGTNSVAAAAVAAHECGHVLQHKFGYSMLTLRTKLVPVVSFSSKWMSWILLAGILLIQLTPIPLFIGIALFALTRLFSFVTLPVEIDASRRAIKWLEMAGITSGETTTYARDALKSAAYTYVVAALGSLATLAYYVLMFLGRRN